MSSTAAKALSLLSFFSEKEPEWGLSELARESGIDKATVHRMLLVLADAGFVEQGAKTKYYRLGAGILRLARVREATFPVTSVVEPVLADLTSSTGETAHASLISGSNLVTVGVSESPKANRVFVNAGQVLDFHSTASGLATLSFLPTETANRHLQGKLKRFTSQTETDPKIVREMVALARVRGYAQANQLQEEGVYGIAAPLFDTQGRSCGAIAVATPKHRMNNELRSSIINHIIAASLDITEKTGGELPTSFRTIAAAQAF